ncbi:DUF881 domain-containing protein [Nocardioides sp. GY 10113]|uniref:DUF881 domain-containing protein n=1 Tax=Nocardioides sp. GY 10113 TaxID=2569761 RepID=UPI0010A7E726|nr:DUF881 domain-containing protein [Nocardioides sp. GY 10113]TIC87625.1 DUF881 domain-containing protein [Nocardioides sp. GY 10113]
MTDVTDRARTPLLTLITQESLDQEYQAVADRRGPGASLRRVSRVGVIAVLGAFALLVTVAAVQTSRNAADQDASRAALIARIESRRDSVHDAQGRLNALREQNALDEQSLRELGDELAALEARRARIGAAAGFTPVVGPGIRVTVDNTARTAPGNVVRDSDLAVLVDALWSAGAEAIAINGHRLTARSAIRNSGTPIEVNSTGIAPPYSVVAVGNVDRLAADFIESDAGQDFLALVNQFAFTYEVDNLSQVRLPAAPVGLLRLRSARELSNEGAERQGGGAA